MWRSRTLRRDAPRQPDQTPNLRTTAGTLDTPWLFLGSRAGKHLDPQSIAPPTQNSGSISLAARNSAIQNLAAEVPPPLVTELIGYSYQVPTAPPAIVGWDGSSEMELRWSTWSFGVMMPVGTDTVLTGQRRARGIRCGCQRVEVSGFGDAAAALGFDVLGPGDALPVAGAASSGVFAGLDPVVDHAGAVAEGGGRPRQHCLPVGVGVRAGMWSFSNSLCFQWVSFVDSDECRAAAISPTSRCRQTRHPRPRSSPPTSGGDDTHTQPPQGPVNHAVFCPRSGERNATDQPREAVYGNWHWC